MKSAPSLRLVILVCSLFVLTLLSGCFETKEEFTLNPDGSGKVVHECTFQNFNISGQDANPEKELKKAVAEILAKAQGVEVWRDMSYRKLDDGRIYFKGTAYFKNISDFEIPQQTMKEFAWSISADGTGVLTLRDKRDGDEELKKAADWRKLSPEERTQKAKAERGEFKQRMPLMLATLGAMKHEAVFHLPGQPAEWVGFTRDPIGALRLQLDGSKILTAMESLVSDDAWFAKNVGRLNFNDFCTNDERMRLLIFGSKGVVRGTVKGLAGAAFDYEAEVAAARDGFATVQQQLNPGPITVIGPAEGGPLRSLKVVGVQLVREMDEQSEIQPFNESAGYSISLLAELPGRVLAMTNECAVDTAIADDGSNLLPEDSFDQLIKFPKLSADKAAVLIEARLKLPGAGVKGIRELSGHMQYKGAETTKELELDFPKLAVAAKTKVLAAEIESFSQGKKRGNTLKLKMEIKPEALKTMYLVVGKSRTELRQQAYGGDGDSYTYTFETESKLPAKGRLIAVIYDQQQLFDVSFKLENITLLGEPSNAK